MCKLIHHYRFSHTSFDIPSMQMQIRKSTAVVPIILKKLWLHIDFEGIVFDFSLRLVVAIDEIIFLVSE